MKIFNRKRLLMEREINFPVIIIVMAKSDKAIKDTIN